MEISNQQFLFVFRKKSTCLLFFSIFSFSFLLWFNNNKHQPQPLINYLSLLSNTLTTPPPAAGVDCDYSNGRWVRDETYPTASYTEACQFLDPGFRCRQNGRNDSDYVKWRWHPHGCRLPRFEANDMLERSRNGRIVFVGDSLGRNQWESLLCMLSKNIRNKFDIYEENGNPVTKHKGYLSMRFREYNTSVEYYRSPFLVAADRPPPNSSKQIQRTIRVDRLDWSSPKWLNANVLIFNDGHWWNNEKTVSMGWYFQEGGFLNLSMDVKQAFQRSLDTWKSWILNNIDLKNTHVFFRSYSPVHFGGGTWNGNGTCENNTEPERDHSALAKESWTNKLISKTIEEMEGKTRNVQFLNVSYLAEIRKDGHPSSHREPGTPVPVIEDCSHWCLPGVPDTWNEMLYAYLLSKDYRTKAKP